MKRCAVWAIVAAVTALIASPDASANGLGRHKKVYAVPRPGKVVIDGKLDDWDLSGQISMYVVQETSEMQSAKFALLYDDEAIYLSAVIRDTTPMMNRHDPKVDADKGWDADACQFRLVTDPTVGYPFEQASFSKDNRPDQPFHLTLWHYTDRQEPVLQLFQSMSYKPTRPDWPQGVAPHNAYQAAYLKGEDGRSYTFEYRIPWATLGAKNPPKAGDIVAGTVQFNWSAPDGLKTAGGSAWAYDVMAGPGFPYQSSACWGRILFAEKGNLPRDLVEEGIPPERPMPLTFAYDVPQDSEVTVQLFDAAGFIRRILVAQGARRAGRNVERWDGLDEEGRPLAPGSYLWRGLYHLPIRTRFILSAHNSGKPPYKLDDNTGGWGADHGNITTACAAGDTMLLAWSMSESGWGIIRVDLKGKKLWGSRHNAEDLATDGERFFVVGDHGYEGENSVKVFDLKDARPLNWGTGKPTLDPPPGGDEKTNVATAVAYRDGVIFVSWTARNLVCLYDAQTGKLSTGAEDTWKVPAPGRLAAHPDGILLITGKEVTPRQDAPPVVVGEKVKFVVAKGKDIDIADHIDEPAGVAADAEGRIYVANRGKLQNISVFDRAGKYIKSIGKEGGRPRVGRYDPSGVLEPGGITVDKQGQLWVSETLDAPRRHSVWDTKTGAFVAEFFGGSSYFGWAYMDPKHPDELYCHNVLWKVDLDKGTCVPWSTIWRPTAPNMIEQPNPGGYAGHFRVFTAKNGKQFGWGMIDYSNMVFIRDGDLFKPFAGTIRIAFGQYGGGILYPVMGDRKKYPEGAYLWQDKNNDQTVQEDELTKSPTGRGETAFNWIDGDLNAWSDAGFMFKPVRFEADGRPVYDYSPREGEAPAEPPGRGKKTAQPELRPPRGREPVPFKGANSNATSLTVDPDDGTVFTLNPGQDPGFAHWTRDGKVLWAYRQVIEWNRALSLPMIAPGRLWGLTMPLGTAGDFTGAACYFGPYHIFTRDGLYVAMVMRDGRSGGLGPDITASEVITGQLVKPEGMNRYFLLAGDQDGRVTEILGLDTVKRLPGGTYEHTEADAKTAASALADYERAKAKSQRLDIVRGRGALDASRGIAKPIDSARSFAVRAAYDAKNLYLAYEVTSPFELTHSIADPRLLFKGGNCLDLQIATDPAADPNRKTPAPGDVRVLITRQGGKPFAVVYRPKAKDFAGQPIVLTSPTGKESFDAIEPTDRIALDYRKQPGGFKAVATVPLDLLGWMPKPGTTVRMDIGYLFGNPTGSQVSLRAYWTNTSFSANVTNDVPNESRLEPKEWGMANVE